MKKGDWLLICLNKECSEIIKATDKALHFGLANGYPGDAVTNLNKIKIEINDMLAVCELLNDAGIFPDGFLDSNMIDKKKEKVLYYMEVAKQLGTLND